MRSRNIYATGVQRALTMLLLSMPMMAAGLEGRRDLTRGVRCSTAHGRCTSASVRSRRWRRRGYGDRRLSRRAKAARLPLPRVAARDDAERLTMSASPAVAARKARDRTVSGGLTAPTLVSQHESAHRLPRRAPCAERSAPIRPRGRPRANTAKRCRLRATREVLPRIQTPPSGKRRGTKTPASAVPSMPCVTASRRRAREKLS